MDQIFDLCEADCEECIGINVEYMKDNLFRCLNTGKILENCGENLDLGHLREVNNKQMR